MAGKLAKAILAQYLGFILAVDEDWAKSHLLPLFGSPESDGYRPAWHGLLYGTLRPQVVNVLEDAVVEAVSRMADLLPGQLRSRFVDLYTLMAIHFVDDPLDSWIPKFFAHASEGDKRELASNIGHRLRSMDNAKQQDWWKRWLRQYWMSRVQGIPASLAGAEIPEMLSWAPHLKSLFPEAVECAIKMPTTPSEGSPHIYHMIIREIVEGDLWSNYPEATVKLLLHIADCEPPQWVWHDGDKLIEKLQGLDLPEELDTQLQELAVRLNLS